MPGADLIRENSIAGWLADKPSEHSECEDVEPQSCPNQRSSQCEDMGPQKLSYKDEVISIYAK